MMILLIIAIVVIIFGLTREFWLWYWKINTLVNGLEKANKLLTKILYNQPDGNLYGNIKDEVIVEDTQTGIIKRVSIAQWQEFISKNPTQTRYFSIKKDEFLPLEPDKQTRQSDFIRVSYIFIIIIVALFLLLLLTST